eukprot:7426075-Pyramimonas_sp.AAC.1
MAVCRAQFEAHGAALAMCEADIEVACRRIPLAPGHVLAAWVGALSWRKGRLWVSQHFVFAFRASGSVNGWGRV